MNQLVDIEIRKVLDIVIQKGVPFVCFSFPGSNNVTFFIKKNNNVSEIHDYSDMACDTGFLVTPFNEDGSDAKIFLQPDLIFDEESNNENIIKQLNQLPDYRRNLEKNHQFSTEKNAFLRNVIAIKKLIKQEKIQKAVLSKIRNIPTNNLEQILPDLFFEINDQYTEAFCYLLFTPQTGMWLGASPESLIQEIDKNYYTYAIAGTRYLNGTPINRIIWTDKEVNEQGLVSAYIKEQFQRLKIADYKTDGPYNQRAAQLVHLKTDFIFRKEGLVNNLGLIIKALHPSPSICGYPSEEAFKIIINTELHARKYYTGLVGPVNYMSASKLFVNIRCLNVLNKEMVLYAGAGITLGSDPEKEWIETEQKLETLLSVFQKINR